MELSDLQVAGSSVWRLSLWFFRRSVAVVLRAVALEVFVEWASQCDFALTHGISTAAVPFGALWAAWCAPRFSTHGPTKNLRYLAALAIACASSGAQAPAVVRDHAIPLASHDRTPRQWAGAAGVGRGRPVVCRRMVDAHRRHGAAGCCQKAARGGVIPTIAKPGPPRAGFFMSGAHSSSLAGPLR
jgi:hypothetical protein